MMTRTSAGKLVLALLVAGVMSFLVGLALVQVTGFLPCRGERLACNIDAAVGAYAVVIWAILGPLIFGIVLAIARNRTALLGAAILLLLPLIAFALVTQSSHATYIGFEPARQFRTLLVTVVPPALAVLVQYLVLRLVVPRSSGDPTA